MRRPERPCADCSKPTTGRRCRFCWRRSLPPVAPPRTKTWAEKMRRAATVRRHREQYGDWCPGWIRPGHLVDPERNPLSADHITPVAAGGTEDGPLQVLCRSCNSTKRDGRTRTTTRRTPRPGQPSRHSRAWQAEQVEQPTEIRSRSW